VPRQRASIATIAAVCLYVAIIGAPVPALRSATMLVLLLATRIAQRPTSRWAIVALGAAPAVFDPAVVLEVGYQLSVLGVSAMIAAGMLGKRLGLHRKPALVRAIVSIVLATSIATIATAPIVAWTFGRISLVAPLSNLFATPLIALAQPMIFLGLLVSPIAPLAHFVADAAHPLLAGLDAVATAASNVPGASTIVTPTVTTAAIAGGMAVSVIIACASREWQRPTLAGASCAALLVWFPGTPVATGDVELHMIDVGQGDAVALRTPHGHWVLFDAGGAWSSGDAGRSTVVPYLGRRGGPLDAFVLSHPHTDHVGGASSVMRALHPPLYIDGGFPGPATAYRASLDEAKRDGVRWARAHPGDSLLVDGVSLTMLAPDSAWTASLVDPIVLVRYGDVRMLLMGDAERPEEEWLLRNAALSLHADILKVGHHGSGTSSSEAFLAAVAARVALVSVGAGNSYHLPTTAVMHRIAATGAQVLRTDLLGTIVARTDGKRIWLAASGDEWELSPQSPPH
jgi:competence protein ComEC